MQIHKDSPTLAAAEWKMSDFFEIDFLPVETKKSGDAITIRYSVNSVTYIHVVDGGYQSTGPAVCAHIRTYYGNPTFIDHVIATHPDGDHLGGLRTVLEEFHVGTLWMLRPWIYAEALLPCFPTYTSADKLRSRLRTLYPNVVALEEIALAKGITIREPLQGSQIGAFTVLSPSLAKYFELLMRSERTPETVEQQSTADSIASILMGYAKQAVNFLKGAWGYEVFSTEETSAENEKSVVQFMRFNNKRILLTADAGRVALTEAATYANSIGIRTPGLDFMQIPHHGSRRNVSTEILDRWLGPRLAAMPQPYECTFFAYVSSAKEDEDHPRKAVIRAFMHRGARIGQTEGDALCYQNNAPNRGWGSITHVPYPTEYET